MSRVGVPDGDNFLLIGFEAAFRGQALPAETHRILDLGVQRYDWDAWYLIRYTNGRYDLRRIPIRLNQPMVSTRAIAVSPFPGDGKAVYFGGYDANTSSAHNTAWIVRASLEAAIGGFQ
jgi:hypothetical protein